MSDLVLPPGAKPKEIEDPHTCSECNTKHWRTGSDQRFDGLCLWMTADKKGPPIKTDPLDWVAQACDNRQVILVLDGTMPMAGVGSCFAFLKHMTACYVTAKLSAEQGRIKREEIRLITQHLMKTMPIR